MRRSVAVLLSLVALFLVPILPAHAQDERCFAETGHCISGRFRTYWEENGGLLVFGFPITAPANETNRDTKRRYLTQWFERNRFELHSENPAPYDVLLGRLGDDGLRKQDRTWQEEPREKGAQAGCHWFAQTGHNICDQAAGSGFKTYWEAHGLELDGMPGKTEDESVALFGYPLTTPQVEVNENNDIVYTQWFERARFEYHPHSPDEFKVLLGLLGNELRGAKGQTPALDLFNTGGTTNLLEGGLADSCRVVASHL